MAAPFTPIHGILIKTMFNISFIIKPIKEEIAGIIFGELPIKKKRIALRKLKQKGLSKEHINLFLKLLDYINEF